MTLKQCRRARPVSDAIVNWEEALVSGISTSPAAVMNGTSQRSWGYWQDTACSGIQGELERAAQTRLGALGG